MPEQDRADVGIWRLVGTTPQRYKPAALEYEKYLEDWIENDPTLVSPDMQLVGRQVSLDTGFLDILGIDNLGRWAVIELKKQGVRRDTVAQALDYAGCLAEMSSAKLNALVKQCFEKRGIKLQDFLKHLALDENVFQQPEILIYVVGTSRDINLDRVLKHTTFQGNPIQVVTFDVYKNSDGEHVLLRQLSEADMTSRPQISSSTSKKTSQVEQPSDKDGRIERLMQLAEKNGIGQEFRKVYELATGFGLYPKTYKWSIMYAPPQNKNRVLICAWVNPKDGLFDVYINTDAFAEFYPISQRKARQIADVPLRYYLTTDQTDQFIAVIQKLFSEISRSS
jgi:hypothetical protein